MTGPSSELGDRVRGAGRGALATLISRLAGVAATYAFYAAIARSISPADFGRIVLAFAVLQTAASVARFGLDQALLAIAPSGPVNRFAAAVVAAIAIAISALTAFALYPLPPYAIWTAVALPAVALGQFVIGALRVRGDVAASGVAEGIVQPGTAAAGAVVAAFTAPSLESFTIAFFASWIVTMLFALRLEWRGPRLGRDEASGLLQTGRSMLFVGVAQQLSTSAEVFLLGYFASAAELGRYAVAQKIAAGFLLLHGALTSAATPFMRSIATEARLLEEYYHFIVRWMVVAALPLLVLILGVPSYLLNLFGHDYRYASAIPLLVLSVASMVTLLSGPAGSVLLCSGHAATLLRVTTAGTAFLIACIALFAHFGAAGVAIGVLLGRIAGRGLLLVAMRRALGALRFDLTLLPIFGGAGAGILVTRATAASIGPVLAVIAGCAIALSIAFVVLARRGDVAALASEFRAAVPRTP